jgi:hypothetical protein
MSSSDNGQCSAFDARQDFGFAFRTIEHRQFVTGVGGLNLRHALAARGASLISRCSSRSIASMRVRISRS